jgi:hypothetical protein
MTETGLSWRKAQRWTLVAMIAVIALFLFCLFYFGSRV